MDYKEITRTLINHVEQNVKSRPNYNELERLVGFSYRHLREIFARVTGISLSRYILTRKIANAAFEIRHTDKTITEIAFEYEFSNLDTFARAFRRETGLTPSGFKNSNHSCGRRLICPGVFAPVILDNPRRAHKIWEVNEMSEMVKTPDSCVLYGVPKVFYGMKTDGNPQLTPFPMCLQAVLNYMGQNISYAEIMAYSGAAFRQRWDKNGWNMAAVDIRFTYEDHLRPFKLAFEGAGRKYKISEDRPKSISKEDSIALIKAELDCGRPLIALGVIGPPEACIVTGYRNNGETLLGWSLFQENGPFGGDCEIDESGYFIKDNWWENTNAVMSIGEDVGSQIPVKTVLENALMLMTKEEIATYGEGCTNFYGGQLAYESWAKAVEDDKNADFCHYSQGDAEVMLGEGRGFAASYMYMLAEKLYHVKDDLTECAGRLEAASACAKTMWESRDGTVKLPDKQVRSQIAAAIRKAAQHEKAACEILKNIITKLD